MGFFKIAKNSDNEENIYIHFITNENCNEISINILDMKDYSYNIVLDSTSEAVEKWAKNRRQTPEIYMSQLCEALENQLLERDAKGIAMKEKRNIFELDGENLIWRQYFESKNIYGRCGKFSLEKKHKDEILGNVFDAVMMELHEKKNSVCCLEKENKSLLKEKEDLAKIAEDCVAIKENFEREIYGKLSLLLNSKKGKNLELRAQIQEFKTQKSSVPNTSTSDNINKFGSMEVNVDDDVDDDCFEVDTDVDQSEEEAEQLDDPSSASTLLKRKGSGIVVNSEVKKSKGKREEDIRQDSFSRDLLHDSLEEELNFASFSSHSIKKKY